MRDIDAFVQNHAFVGREHAGEQIEEGGLAGAVRADDARDLKLAQREIDVIDRDQRAETLGHRLRLQNFNAHAVARFGVQE